MPSTMNLLAMGAAVSSRGQRGPPSYNPVADIPWEHAYYVEGINYLAQGYADAASITTLPDEIGSADLTVAPGTSLLPAHETSAVSFNGLSAWNFNGSSSIQTTSAWSTVSAPFEIVIVATYPGGGGFLFDGDNATYRAILTENEGLWAIWAGYNYDKSTVLVDSDPHNHSTYVSSGSANSMFLDNVNITGGNQNSGSENSQGVTLGSRYTGDSSYGLDRAVFYGIKNGSLTSEERSDLNGFFSTKYGF
jgi:hypothetical protein